ncbi:uncharacterized protein LOC135157276 [Lytechinus pictus]|uniref:uncharacterized protein LOC135157276 n=1 Tax=Lytechinus pictus TaxID=7653 RepID=UPI0030B9D9EB
MGSFCFVLHVLVLTITTVFIMLARIKVTGAQTTNSDYNSTDSKNDSSLTSRPTMVATTSTTLTYTIDTTYSSTDSTTNPSFTSRTANVATVSTTKYGSSFTDAILYTTNTPSSTTPTSTLTEFTIDNATASPMTRPTIVPPSTPSTTTTTAITNGTSQTNLTTTFSANMTTSSSTEISRRTPTVAPMTTTITSPISSEAYPQATGLKVGLGVVTPILVIYGIVVTLLYMRLRNEFAEYKKTNKTSKTIGLREVNSKENMRYGTDHQIKQESSEAYQNQKIVKQQQHLTSKNQKRFIDDNEEYSYAIEHYP